ncbi:abcC8 [Symbiodinium microadriaticum]|nr:abcC8 [Symbiodinium microadriaticum]
MSRRRGRDAGERPLSGAPELRDGASMSEQSFRAVTESDFDFILFEVLGDRFEKLGLAVGKVSHKFPVDGDGMYLELSYVATDNPYYRWYIENEGRPKGLPSGAYHHLCRRHASRCNRAIGHQDVIHVQKWAPISRASVNDLLVSWGMPQLKPEKAVRGTSAKAKAKRNDEQALAALPAPREEDGFMEEEEAETWEKEELKPALKRKRRTASKPQGETTALDAMLNDNSMVDNEPQDSESKIDKKLGQLRAKLQGKKEEAQRKGPGSVLAGRAMEAAGKVQPKRSRDKDSVVRSLQRALKVESRSRGSKDPVSSDESGGDDEEEDELDLGGGSTWESRRRKLRKVAEERPGRLLMSGLQSMHDQLGQATGDSSGDSMSPVMVRYLLTMVLPAHPIKAIGEAKYRELRFKSLVMGLRDDSDRKVSPERTSEKDTERRVTFADEAPPKKDGHTKMQMPVSEVKSRGKQQTKKLIAAGCFQIWRLLSVIVLNGEFQGWMPPLFPHRSFPGLASQQQAFKHIDGVCSYFVREPQSSHSGLAPQELVRTKGVDYTGEEVLHALPLKLEELLPSLPADGVAGSLQACEVAEGEIAEWLLNPERALLPRDQWPKPIPKATMNCSRDEWDRLVPVLVGKGILQPIRKHEILHVEGIPLLNGAFAVPKKGLPGPGQQRVTRLIMNMIPGNSIQRLMPGDLGTLASASQWVSAHLKPGQVLLWSGDDQRGAFYAWALPTAWRQYMAFRWPVAGHLVGMPHEVEVYVAAAVIPMGWINAVGLFQHLHRRLGLAAEPVGAEHPAELEWRRDRPVPRSAVTESGGAVAFQENFEGTGGPRILVVSLLDGIGALMVALTRLPCQVVAYASSEVDKACRRVARRRWPGMIELGEVSSIELKALELLRRSIGQDVDCVLVGARSYCQTRSASDKSHDKLDGGRPRLLHEVSRIIGLLKSCFSVPVHFLVETDSHVNSSHTQLINTELGCEPLLIDSKWFSWCRGTRLFWCSWTPGASEVERIIQHGNHTEWLFPCCRGEASDWLEAGATWNGKPNEWLPPLSQRKARRTPPSSPVGIENASPEAIARWRTDQYRMEVCNYEPNVMITCVDGKIRLASLKEREVLMGFDAGYVESTLPHNMPAHEKLYLGGRMVGGSPCVHVVVMLCHSLLCELGVHHVRDHEALVKKVGVAPPSWLLFPKFAKQPSSSQSSEQLVMHFCRHAERGGTDVRLDLGVPFRARAWPRAGINSSLFHWSVVHGYSWKHSAHINVLELQAVVNSLKWRLRKVGGGNCRILHLIDNQAVCGIIAKGRTSSSRLKPGLRKLNALVLASGVVMAVGYVATDSNPSDIPSRWSQRSRIHKSKRGKTIAKDRR